MKTEHGQINRVDKFKYLGEWIQPNGLDNTTNKQRVKKLELAYRITQNHYNKKAISIRAKIRHYSTVIKPEATYGSECLTMNTEGELREMAVRERKILRKVLGPLRNTENTMIKRKNKELYRNTEKITDTMRKRSLKFNGHLERMNENRNTNKKIQLHRKIDMYNRMDDAEKVGLTEELFNNKENNRLQIDNARFPEDRSKPRPKRV
ncbi:hypothetical protein PR048_013164 [Dryococelus australis]|uniref:Uncharacterized protein n=1 Tax=Dryococelus australis TaxID=614101 RepID=A0ABQ9HRD9_9NEOP|nr:hypothetical protein PR048_013164 [Dryococelus australis]